MLGSEGTAPLLWGGVGFPRHRGGGEGWAGDLKEGAAWSARDGEGERGRSLGKETL